MPREITRIEVPEPEPLQPAPDGGAETQGVAYRLTAPAVATEPLTVTAPDGTTFAWVPTELCYRDESGRWDYIVGSAPATVEARDHEARYRRTFPAADDVFLAEAERVKHWVILHEPPRPPAEYLSGTVEFGVAGLVTGVTLPEGRHEAIEAGPFRLPKPVAKDLAGREIEGYYEVVEADGGKQLFMWFHAADMLGAVYPVTIDPTIAVGVVSSATWSHGTHLVAIAPDGTIYAVVRPASNALQVYRSLDGGQTWSSISYPGPSRQPYGIQDIMAAVAVTSDGKLHLVIRYYHRPYNTDYDVVEYRRYAGGSWGGATIIDEFVRTAATGMAMTVGPDGKLHLVYPGPNNWIRYAVYDGAAWSAPQDVASGTSPSFPTVAIDANGRIMAVWVESRSPERLYFAVRQGTSWSTPAPVYDAGVQQLSPFVVVDGNNLFHLFCVQQGVVVHLRYAGSIWTTPATVPGVASSAGAPAASVEWPIIVHVFWRDYLTSSGQYRIAMNSFDGAQWGTAKGVVVGGTGIYASNPYNPAVPPRATVRLPVVYTHYKYGSAYSPTGYYAESVTLLVNDPPNAPSLVDVGPFDATQSVTLQWTFSDPDAGDTQSAYQLVVKRNTDGVTVYDTGKVASTANSHTMPGGTLANGQRYRWTVRTWDSADQAGPYAAERTLVTSAKPTATITAPAQDGAVVSEPSLRVEWSISDPESRGQSAYRLRLRNGSGGTVLDTGQVADATARAYQLRDLQHGQQYTLELTVWDGDGVASDPVTRTFQTIFTPPPTPSARVEAIDGRVRIIASNPDVSTDNPAVHNNIYRRAVGEQGPGVRIARGVPLDGAFDDYAVASGVAYEYRVEAIGTNGAPSSSPWVAAPVLQLTGAWLHDPADPPGTLRQYRVAANPQRGEDWEPERALLEFAGRSLPVAEFGEHEDQQVHCTILIMPDRLDDLDALRALTARRSVVCYRDSAGRRIFGVLGPLRIRDERHGGYTVDLEITAVDYDEAV